MMYGDLATVLAILVANQRRLAEMVRRIDRDAFAWYPNYDEIFADLAEMDRLLVAPDDTTEPEPDADSCPPQSTEPGSGIAPGSPYLDPDPKTGKVNI